MARSAIGMVLAQWRPVNPKHPTKPDSFKQPAYIRSKHAIQTSQRLKEFQSCVQEKLSGTHPGTQKAVREALARAAQECRV